MGGGEGPVLPGLRARAWLVLAEVIRAPLLCAARTVARLMRSRAGRPGWRPRER